MDTMRPEATLACLTSRTSAVKLLLATAMLFGLIERVSFVRRSDCRKPCALARQANCEDYRCKEGRAQLGS